MISPDQDIKQLIEWAFKKQSHVRNRPIIRGSKRIEVVILGTFSELVITTDSTVLCYFIVFVYTLENISTSSIQPADG